MLLPHIDLLVLNTYGTGIDIGELCRKVRASKRGLPILHIGSTNPDHLVPGPVPNTRNHLNTGVQVVGL